MTLGVGGLRKIDLRVAPAKWRVAIPGRMPMDSCGSLQVWKAPFGLPEAVFAERRRSMHASLHMTATLWDLAGWSGAGDGLAVGLPSDYGEGCQIKDSPTIIGAAGADAPAAHVLSGVSIKRGRPDSGRACRDRAYRRTGPKIPHIADQAFDDVVRQPPDRQALTPLLLRPNPD